MRHSLHRTWNSLRENWAPLVIVLGILVLHRDLLQGEVPATGDHMTHLFKAWLMSEKMLPSGRLTGWSHMVMAGYPAGVFYPILGDLLVTATHKLSFGLLSLERAYSLTFLALLVALPLVVYFIGKRAAGPTGGFIAAVLATGDVGQWPQGGHYTTVHYGVWPFMLGLALTFGGILVFEKALASSHRGSTARLPVNLLLKSSLCIALAILAHPMTIFFLGLGLPLLTLVTIVDRRRELAPKIILKRAILVALAVVMFTVFWLAPWVGSGGEWTLEWPHFGFGGQWLSLGEMLSSLVQNELFKNFDLIALVLGALGLPLALLRPNRFALYLALFLLVAFLFTGLCHELGDGVIKRKVQIERMAALLKFLWFALASVAVHQLGLAALHLGKRIPMKFGRLHRAMNLKNRNAFVGLTLGALLVIVGWDSGYKKVGVVGQLGGDLWNDIVASEQWLGQQPHGPLDRVLTQGGPICTTHDKDDASCKRTYHSHIFASGPLRTGLPRLKFGYQPTVVFENVPMHFKWLSDLELIVRYSDDVRVFENLHIRWVVSLVDWPNRTFLKEVARFGEVLIYSVSLPSATPVRLEGPGQLTLLEFSDENIAVRVQGARADSRLLFPVAHFYPWHAYHEGVPIPVKTRGVLPGVREILMTTEARNGTVELRYERPLHERLLGWLSLLSWSLALAALLAHWVHEKRRARS